MKNLYFMVFDCFRIELMQIILNVIIYIFKTFVQNLMIDIMQVIPELLLRHVFILKGRSSEVIPTGRSLTFSVLSRVDPRSTVIRAL